ncbi:MAG: hypothetical protein M3386_02090 [Actinomycetota bacterium]|nr:hypothetical protein [Actinomycetota bacterium]
MLSVQRRSRTRLGTDRRREHREREPLRVDAVRDSAKRLVVALGVDGATSVADPQHRCVDVVDLPAAEQGVLGLPAPQPSGQGGTRDLAALRDAAGCDLPAGHRGVDRRLLHVGRPQRRIGEVAGPGGVGVAGLVAAHRPLDHPAVPVRVDHDPDPAIRVVRRLAFQAGAGVDRTGHGGVCVRHGEHQAEVP